MDSHLLLCSHNGEKFIKEQLNSILNQDEKIEFLHIFDFASTDQTINILEELKSQYPDHQWRITKVEHAPGAAASFFYAIRNLAPQVQPQDCIFFADQDDVWLHNKTSVIKELFINEITASPKKRLLLFHDVAIVNETLQTTQPSFYTGNPYSVPRDLACDRLLLCNPVIGHTMAISGALLQLAAKKLHSSNYLMHDWAITLLASRTGRIVYANTPALSLYRQHNTNILGAPKKTNLVTKFYRTFSFSKKVTKQANEFSSLLKEIEKEIPQHNTIDNLLKKIKERKIFSWLIYPLLGFMAILRGPTLQRKLLSIFIFMRWII